MPEAATSSSTLNWGEGSSALMPAFIAFFLLETDYQSSLWHCLRTNSAPDYYFATEVARSRYSRTFPFPPIRTASRPVFPRGMVVIDVKASGNTSW